MAKEQTVTPRQCTHITANIMLEKKHYKHNSAQKTFKLCCVKEIQERKVLSRDKLHGKTIQVAQYFAFSK